jgi:hypothetical protein
MNRRLWLAVAIVVVPLVGYVAVTLADGAPRFPGRYECVRSAVDGQPVDVVFGRSDDPVSADELRDQVVSVGFVGVESEPDGCGRWKVLLADVPSLETARAVQEEAERVDLAPTLELGSET